MKYFFTILVMYLALTLTGCVKFDRWLNDGTSTYLSHRFERLYQIDMGDNLYYTYAMRDSYTNQEVICTVGSCYPTGRFLDHDHNIINEDGSLKYPPKY